MSLDMATDYTTRLKTCRLRVEHRYPLICRYGKVEYSIESFTLTHYVNSSHGCVNILCLASHTLCFSSLAKESCGTAGASDAAVVDSICDCWLLMATAFSPFLCTLPIRHLVEP
jgi:hypothetical protein